MKSMKVPVLVFEYNDDVDILMAALESWNEMQNKYSKHKVHEKLNEIYKIKAILDNTNNN